MGSPNPRSFSRGTTDNSIKYYTRSANIVPSDTSSGSFVVSEGVAPSAYLMAGDLPDAYSTTNTTDNFEMVLTSTAQPSTTYSASNLVAK